MFAAHSQVFSLGFSEVLKGGIFVGRISRDCPEQIFYNTRERFSGFRIRFLERIFVTSFEKLATVFLGGQSWFPGGGTCRSAKGEGLINAALGG